MRSPPGHQQVNLNEFGAAADALSECLAVDPTHYHARLTRASVAEEQAGGTTDRQTDRERQTERDREIDR